MAGCRPEGTGTVGAATNGNDMRAFDFNSIFFELHAFEVRFFFSNALINSFYTSFGVSAQYAFSME